MASAVRFIRKDGRVIPIAAAAAGAGVAANRITKVARSANAIVQTKIKKQKTQPFSIRKGLDAAGFGLSVASGAIAAATFAGGAKGLAGGFIASHALDALGIGTNVAAVAGRGHAKERAKLAAKNEARNFIVGNAVYAAGVLGVKRNRAALIKYSAKILEIGKKVLRVA